ncbi:YeeE/YedE family protein [Roseobacter sp.]|uniref:YeeE/YedE family protein n=1 Tax=Roseobacter sp. TaxID=1907202 RepID=UPI0025FD5916|nr:YeeE/YedE family protein [Roseobacter sp.]
MLLELYDLSLPVHTLHLLFALAIGAVFGACAQISRFCLRRAVAGEGGPDSSAASVWISALAVSVGAFAAARFTGFVEVSDHRLMSANIPVLAIVTGGVLFGAGMVLTRGCVSRLTVLSGTGNLRAVVVLAVFALVAHATLKGVLAPLRTALGSVSVDLPVGTLASAPGVAPALSIGLMGLALYLARSSGTRPLHILLGGVIGMVSVAGWMTTSVLLFDEFDPLPAQSAAFTLPWSDTLFWFIASSAIPAGFGAGFIGGVVLGSFSSAALRGELALQSFTAPSETLRYISGGALMGLGGVLAGGCTVGAGLSGGAMLSVSALLALGSIIAGAALTRQFPAFRRGARALA